MPPPPRLQEARLAALRGELDTALPVLVEMAEAGDAAASASLAELLAYLGRWDDVIAAAGRLVADPLTVYAGNVHVDMIQLLGRAGHETGRWSEIAALADAAWSAVDAHLAANPEGFPESKIEGLRGSMLVPIDRLGEYALDKGRAVQHDTVNLFLPKIRPRNNRQRYEATLKHNRKASPARRMTFACLCGVEDEMLRLAEELGDALEFDHAVSLAPVLLRHGRPEDAAAAIEQAWPRWGPVDYAQVAPVCLVVEDDLRDVMTCERCARLLRKPRAAFMWS